MGDEFDSDRLEQLQRMERLSETLSDRDAGDLFSADLEEASALAEADERYRPLVEGLRSDSLGERLRAIDRFFESFDPVELSHLDLPQNLSQLRFIYLRSHPDWPSGE